MITGSIEICPIFTHFNSINGFHVLAPIGPLGKVWVAILAPLDYILQKVKREPQIDECESHTIATTYSLHGPPRP